MQQVLLYKDSMTNLVKALRQDDFVQVGSKWRPKRIVMQDFKLRTKDVLSLDWQVAANVPAACSILRRLRPRHCRRPPPHRSRRRFRLGYRLGEHPAPVGDGAELLHVGFEADERADENTRCPGVR